MTTGYVLLINNENFVDVQNRKGTQEDAKKLIEFFRDTLKWRVNEEKDKKVGEMKTLVKSISKCQDFPFKALFIIILSHGTEDGILGVGSEKITLKANTLVDYFKEGEAAPVFKGIPKFFIVQACRGEKDDVQRDGACKEKIQPKKTSIPTMTNFLIAYPCLQGYTALRIEETGSRFIQELVRNLRLFYKQEDILAILNRVNFKLAGINIKYNEKEQPCFEVALQCKCFFKQYFEKIHDSYQKHKKSIDC